MKFPFHSVKDFEQIFINEDEISSCFLIFPVHHILKDMSMIKICKDGARMQDLDWVGGRGVVQDKFINFKNS